MRYHVKNLDILNLAPMLKKIVSEVNRKYGLDVITDLGRPGNKGVHGTLFVPPFELRGIDMRVRDDQMGAIIAYNINVNYIYDPNRPTKKVAMYHDAGSGQHLHLQTHPNTVERRLEG